MAENLPADVVPDEPLPEGVVADAPLPEGVVADEPEVPNLGIMPMPSRAEHRAALQAPPTALATAPGARTLGGPEFTAFQATHSGVNSDQAAQALRLAKATGFDHSFVAQNLDAIQQRVDQTGFEDGLGLSPVLADYAAKGPVQASLIKDDLPALGALGVGFLDLEKWYLTRKYFGNATPENRRAVEELNQRLSAFDATQPGIVSQTARMLPTVGVFVGGSVLGFRLAKQGGAVAAPFIIQYQSHVGELYMRMQDVEAAKLAADPNYVPRTDREIREYAKKGAIVSSTLFATLGSLVSRTIPVAASLLEKAGFNIVAKAGEDSAVQAIVKRLTEGFGESAAAPYARAAAVRVGEAGTHALAGALTMAGTAVADDATVQKATTGKIDVGQATKAGVKAFKDALGPVAILSLAAPVHSFYQDLGRISESPIEAADLAAKVEQAKASKLVKRAPEEAEKLFRVMADGSGSETAYVAEFDKLPLQIAQAVARAAGQHAIADARVTGGDVAVPIGKYLTQLPDHHEAIKDNVKLSVDGFSPKEAAEAQKDTLTSLMAQRSWILQTEPTATPERTAKLTDLEARMRATASRGPGRTGAGRVATEEEMKQAAADYAQMKPPGQEQPQGAEPTLAQTSPYEVPKPPKVTADDYSVAREHIEEKMHGSIDPKYYETQARKAGERALKLATGPDKTGEKIQEKYAEALGVSLDSLRNAVQGTFSADTLPAARRKLRTAESEANRLESGRLETLKALEEQHAANVAMRQGQIQAEVQFQKNGKLFAEVAHDIRNEMDKMETRLLSKASDADFLGKLIVRNGDGTAGWEYRDAHDAIFSAIFGDNAPQQGALETLLARMDNEAQPVAFDVDALRGLLADPKEWRELTPPEARNLSDAVMNIREMAQRMNQIARSDRLQSLREFIAQVGEEASTRKDIGAPRLTRSTVTTGESLMRQAGAFDAANLKPETIFSRLGETAQSFFEDSIIVARNKVAQFRGEILRYFQDNFDKQMRSLKDEFLKPVETNLTVPKEVDLDGSRMNQETLAMAFLNLGTFSNEQTLLGGYGWEKQDVLDSIGKNLKPETVRILQGILSYNDKTVWPLVREHAAKGGVTPPHIVAQPITITFADGTTETFEGGYFPRAAHPDALNVPSREGDGIQNLDRFAQATVRASFTKLRVEGAEYPVDLNWSRYPAHLDSVFHYLAYDEPVRDIGRLLKDDEFRGIVRHRVGPEYLKQLDDDLRIWARGNADGMRSISLPSRMVSRVLRTRAVSNALAFSTPIALGQESHIQYAIASGQISLKNGTAAMGRALVPETWQAANETFSELRFRSDHFAKQFREALQTGSSAKGDVMRAVDIAAFAQMDIADRILSHVITDAAYNDAIDQGVEHPDAVTYANRKLRLLMPTHNVLEMAPIVRDRGTIGALMLFRGLPNVVWNVESTMFDDAHQQMAAAIGAKDVALAGGRYALNGARAVASLAVLHMLGRFFMGHGKKEEDGEGIGGWGTWAAREAISSQFSRIPLGRDVAEPFVDALFHDKTADEAIRELASGKHLAPDVAVVYGILRDMATAANEAKDPEDRVQAGVNTLATFAGVGARPITRAWRYGYDVTQGNRSPRGPFDVAGGVIYGERDRQDKNPFTTIQDLISGER